VTDSVDLLLARARAELDRVSPVAAAERAAAGAAIVDIRGWEQIERDGTVPGAVVVPRNVLEWRLEPGGEWSIPELSQPGRDVIVLCREGYQSSLAAATLRRLGVDATDVEGGFLAWREAGLPVEPTEPGAQPEWGEPPIRDRWSSTVYAGSSADGNPAE
jgi:rhodanese-related sulfurtransferase